MKLISSSLNIAAIACVCLCSCNGSSDDPVTPPAAEANIVMSELDGASDMIELYNAGTSEASLEGYKVRRMRVNDGIDDEQTLWTGTAGAKIAAGGYLKLTYELGKEDNAKYPYNLHNDFSPKKNAYIWLQTPDGKQKTVFQRGVKSVGWNQINMQKAEGYSYSYDIASGKWYYAVPTPGRQNGQKAADIDQEMFYVVINEIDLVNSRFELYNNSDKAVDISGMQLRWSRLKDSDADNYTLWQAEPSTTIQPKSFLLVEFEATKKVDVSQFTQNNIHLRFRHPEKTDFTGRKLEWDDFKRGERGNGWTTEKLRTNITKSIVRIPDGTGDWYLGDPTPGKSNGTSVSGGLCPDVEQ